MKNLDNFQWFIVGAYMMWVYMYNRYIRQHTSTESGFVAVIMGVGVIALIAFINSFF